MIDWTKHTIGTSRDPERRHQRQAIQFLNNAQDCRISYDAVLGLAIRTYGDVVGTPISGIYNGAFPEDVKTTLRKLLSDLNLNNHNAAVCWKRAGRRMESFRPLLDLARKLPDGRISYY